MVIAFNRIKLTQKLNHRPREIGRTWLWGELEKIVRFKNLKKQYCFSKRPSFSGEKQVYASFLVYLWLNQTSMPSCSNQKGFLGAWCLLECLALFFASSFQKRPKKTWLELEIFYSEKKKTFKRIKTFLCWEHSKIYAKKRVIYAPFYHRRLSNWSEMSC